MWNCQIILFTNVTWCLHCNWFATPCASLWMKIFEIYDLVEKAKTWFSFSKIPRLISTMRNSSFLWKSYNVFGFSEVSRLYGLVGSCSPGKWRLRLVVNFIFDAAPALAMAGWLASCLMATRLFDYCAFLSNKIGSLVFSSLEIMCAVGKGRKWNGEIEGEKRFVGRRQIQIQVTLRYQ